MLGERLYDLRKDADLTQDELAAILNINKHSISSYERNKSEPPDVIKIEIARYFNISVDYLLGLTDVPTAISQKQLIVRLPLGFPRSALKELYIFAEYLMFRERREKGNNTKDCPE